jgi:hypothetical protein
MSGDAAAVAPRAVVACSTASFVTKFAPNSPLCSFGRRLLLRFALNICTSFLKKHLDCLT